MSCGIARYRLLRGDLLANSKDRNKMLFVISDGGDGASADDVWMQQSVSGNSKENVPKNDVSGRDVLVYTYTVGSTTWMTSAGHLKLSCNNDGTHTSIRFSQAIAAAGQDYYLKHTSCNTAAAEDVPTSKRVEFTQREDVAAANDAGTNTGTSPWKAPTLQWSNFLRKPHHHHVQSPLKTQHEHRADGHLRKRAGIILSAPVFVPLQLSAERDGGGGERDAGEDGEADAVGEAHRLDNTKTNSSRSVNASLTATEASDKVMAANHHQCKNNGTLRAAVSIEIPLHAVIAASASKLPALDVALQEAGNYYFLVGLGGEVVSHPRLFSGSAPKSATVYKAVLEHVEPGLTRGQRKALRGDKAGSFISNASSCDLPGSELVPSFLAWYQAKYTFSLLDKTPYTVVSVRPAVPFAAQQEAAFSRVLRARGGALAKNASEKMVVLYPAVLVDAAVPSGNTAPNMSKHILVASRGYTNRSTTVPLLEPTASPHMVPAADVLQTLPEQQLAEWFDATLGDLCRSREPPKNNVDSSIRSNHSDSLTSGGGNSSGALRVKAMMPVTACFLVTRQQTLLASVQRDRFTSSTRQNATLAYRLATPSDGSNRSTATSMLVPAVSAAVFDAMPTCGGVRWSVDSGLLVPLTIAAPGSCKPLHLSVHSVPGLAAELVVARFPSACTNDAGIEGSVLSCDDASPSCTAWSDAGFCVGHQYSYYMMENCKKSCSFCTTARAGIGEAMVAAVVGGEDGSSVDSTASPNILAVDEIVPPLAVTGALVPTVATLEEQLHRSNDSFPYPFHTNGVVPNADGVVYPHPDPMYAKQLRPLHSMPHCGGSRMVSTLMVSVAVPMLLITILF